MCGGRPKPRRNDLYKEAAKHRTYLDHNPDQHDKDDNQIQIKKPLLMSGFFVYKHLFKILPKYFVVDRHRYPTTIFIL